MSLASEKRLLQEIAKLSQAKKNHEVAQDRQSDIDLCKKEIGELRDSIKMKERAADEIREMLAKLKVASGLNCSASDLVERIVAIPPDTLGGVIGKGGANLKSLEDDFKVRADVNKAELVIKLTGTPEACDLAIAKIENITLAVEETHELPDFICSKLLSNKAEILNDLQNMQPGLRLSITKGTSSVKMHGRQEAIAATLSAISEIDHVREHITLGLKEIGVVIGKGGATIKELEAKNGIKIDILSRDEGASENIAITGPKDSVETTIAAIELLVVENEEIEEELEVSNTYRNLLLGDSAVVIKSIIKTSSAFLSISRPEEKNGKSTLTFKGTRTQIASAKELYEKAIEDFEETVTTITIDPGALPALIGKGGETIKAIRKESGASVEVDWDANKIRIQSEDDEKVTKAKAAIEEILRNNVIAVVEVGQTLIPLLLGSSGKETRNKVIDEIGCKLEVIQETRDIKLRGTEEKLKEAVAAVQEFLDRNYTATYEIGDEDRGVLLSGGNESIIKKVGEEFSVNVSLRKDDSTVRVRGEKDGVDRAIESLKRTLHGGDGVAVEDVSIDESARGVVIGRNGANIKKLESDHNIKVSVLTKSNALRLRGAPDDVANATKEIIVFIASQRISKSIEMKNDKEKKMFGRGSPMTRHFLALGVSPNMNKDGVLKLTGCLGDVHEARRMVLETTTGRFDCTIDLDMVHMLMIGTISSPHWQRIIDISRAIITIEPGKNIVVVEGTREQVSKAMDQIHGYFGFCLNDRFLKVPVEEVRSLNPGDLATIGNECGVVVVKDYFCKCVCIRSKESDAVALEKARKMVWEKVKEWESMNEFVEVDEWGVSAIIGKGGEVISKLREESGARIDMDARPEGGKKGKVRISGGDEERKKALEMVNELLEKAKDESRFVDLPAGSLGTFIGRKGAGIKSMQEATGCSFEMVGDGVRIKAGEGEECRVEMGEKAVEEWVIDWKKKNFSIEMDVDAAYLGIVIGSKGETIRKVEEECGGVRVEVGKGEETKVRVSGEVSGVEKAVCMIRGLVEEEEKKRQERQEQRIAEQEQRASERRDQQQSKGADEEKKDKVVEENVEEDVNPIKEAYQAVPVGAYGFEPVLSKNAKKRKNKKERQEEAAKLVETEQARGLLENLLTSSPKSSPKRGAEERSATKLVVTPPRGTNSPPPPPGLGFTPRTKGKVATRAFPTDLNGVMGNPSLPPNNGPSSNGDEDSDSDDDEFFVSSSGISVRL